ncbi:MAG: DUF998 domain-containing protein [Maribacter sp.]
MNNKLVFWAGILGVSIFVVASIIGGFQMDAYDPISQYISETMAVDTPYGKELRYFGYIPSGVLLTIFSFTAFQKFPESKLIKSGFLGIGVFYGMATIIVGIFPCDKGCNPELIDPSISQIIHNLTGMLTYLCVPMSIILIGVGLQQLNILARLSKIAVIFGLTTIVFIGLLFAEPSSNHVGLYQRIVETIFVLWIIACAIAIKNKIPLGNTE